MFETSLEQPLLKTNLSACPVPQPNPQSSKHSESVRATHLFPFNKYKFAVTKEVFHITAMCTLC